MDPSPPEARRIVPLGDDDNGLRLDVAIARHLSDLSRSRLQALIAEGRVTLDGAVVKASAAVRSGQQVVVRVPAPAPAEPQGEDIPFAIVFEDADILVLDKPAGLVVHPGAGRVSGTLVNALLHHVKDLSGVGGVTRPGIVHRLDAGTSGLLVVAKNDAAHRALARQFERRTVEKEYVAVVHGSPPQAQGLIEAPIGRDPRHRQKMSASAGRGRAARSSYAVAESLDGASLVRVKILTGRTHQIRVHTASIHCPLVGDRAYGGGREPSSKNSAAREAIRGFGRPALHAARLSFDHPTTGERRTFESPLPKDLRELVLALKLVQ